MDRAHLERLLASLQAGEVSLDEAMERLARWPVVEMDEATVDTHRALRTGVPEVIFGQGKTPDQILAIAETLSKDGVGVLATRLAPEAFDALQQRFGAALEVDHTARTAWLPGRTAAGLSGTVMVVCAGTSDLPVAREAAFTARAFGLEVETAWDVGVAGIHRILRHRDRLARADVIIVVAGMDGALPAVVGGLVSGAVIAVPTSVGYGASFQGVSALLTMLNSCAPGVTVVNIDNGFGAAYAARRILRGVDKPLAASPTPKESHPAPPPPPAPPLQPEQRSDPGEIVLLECNIDDMPGTRLGDLMSRLFEAGALDAWFTPIQMKKNRPAIQLSVLVDGEKEEAILDRIFVHSTTLGVRASNPHRVTLERRQETSTTRHGEVRVKRAFWRGREVSRRPESDDLARLSRATGRPIDDLEREILNDLDENQEN